MRAVSIKQSANRRDWETQGDKRKTRPLSRRPSIWHPTADPEPASGRKRETSGGHDLEPASQHLASDRGDWETQGDKCKTRPRSQRHSVWDLTGETLQDTGRQAGDTTRPRSIWHLTAQTGRQGASGRRDTQQEHLASDCRDWETEGDKRETPPWSQRLVSDRRDWETQAQGDKRETRPRSQLASDRRETSGRHNPAASATASGNWGTGRRAGDTRPRSRRHSIWHLTAETGRHRETSGRHDPGAGATASDRRDRETQKEKRETRPRSRRHSIWHLTPESASHFLILYTSS